MNILLFLRFNFTILLCYSFNVGVIMKLKIIIEKDDTGYYLAEVPALPGCLSQGKTITEAKENIKEAITGWFEVMNNKMESQHKNIYEVYEELV